MYMVAFSAVFISILAILLIDVFVKKGSLIFVKMSEDLEIDAEIRPAIKQVAYNQAQMGSFTNFNFNMTRIDEMQEEAQQKGLQRGKPYVKHQLTPRIVLEAIDEIRGHTLGFYSNKAE